MNDKTYMFNPFNIKKIKEVEIAEMYQKIVKELIDDPLTMYHYAHNIEVYSNLNYLIGEVVARLTKDVLEIKTKIKINSAIKCVEERKNWNVEEFGKHPAISYFEALGTRFCENDIKLLADKECSLKRFKNASESIIEKINAIKKKMESIKFEENFN